MTDPMPIRNLVPNVTITPEALVLLDTDDNHEVTAAELRQGVAADLVTFDTLHAVVPKPKAQTTIALMEAPPEPPEAAAIRAAADTGISAWESARHHAMDKDIRSVRAASPYLQQIADLSPQSEVGLLASKTLHLGGITEPDRAALMLTALSTIKAAKGADFGAASTTHETAIRALATIGLVAHGQAMSKLNDQLPYAIKYSKSAVSAIASLAQPGCPVADKAQAAVAKDRGRAADLAKGLHDTLIAIAGAKPVEFQAQR